MQHDKQNEAQIKRAVQEQFGRNAQKYVVSESHAKGEDLAWMIDWMQPSLHWRVLDVATGAGHVAKALAPVTGAVFATDLTPPMLRTAAKHLTEAGLDNVYYVVADAENLPFLDESFDAVTCRIAAHHFPDPVRFVFEATRVLKQGGTFLFIDNVAPDQPALAEFINTIEKLRDNSHVRSLSVGEWCTLFETQGLIVERCGVRKKTLPFSSWVHRTVTSEQDVQRVAQLVREAQPEIKQYFIVQDENETILSLSLDECMVLCSKVT